MIDFQGLLQVLKAGEENPELDMGAWVEPTCSTRACLIGSFCQANSQDRLILVKNRPVLLDDLRLSSIEAIAIRFRITIDEANWLFNVNPLGDILSKCNQEAEFFTLIRLREPHAACLSGQRALSRLRKFIYYKLHKQEMIIEVGRNKQRIDQGKNIAGNKSAVLASHM